jgi:hypothetical protein
MSVNVTTLRMDREKLKYELGITKHKLREAEARIAELEANAKPQVKLGTIDVGPVLIRQTVPTVCYSAYGLRHIADEYGLDPKKPKQTLIREIRDYEKAQGWITDKIKEPLLKRTEVDSDE